MTQSYDPRVDWEREDEERADLQTLDARMSHEEASNDVLRESVTALTERAEGAEKQVAQLEAALTEFQAAYERLMASRQGRQTEVSPLVRRMVAETLERTYVEGWMSQADAVMNTIEVVVFGHTPRGGQR